MKEELIGCLIGLLSAGAWWWIIKNYKGKEPEEYIYDSYANLPKYLVISLLAIPMGLAMLPFLIIRKILK